MHMHSTITLPTLEVGQSCAVGSVLGKNLCTILMLRHHPLHQQHPASLPLNAQNVNAHTSPVQPLTRHLTSAKQQGHRPPTKLPCLSYVL